MGLDSKYGDPDLKAKGKWFDISGDDARVKIRHLGNEDMARFFRENRDVFPSGTNQQTILRNGSPEIDEEALEDAMNEGIARHILTDWENLSLDDPELADRFDAEPGESIEYTQENAQILLEALPPFRADVWNMAAQEQAFRNEQAEEDEKN